MDDVEEPADDLMNSRKQFAVAAPRSVFPFRIACSSPTVRNRREAKTAEESRLMPTTAVKSVGQEGKKRLSSGLASQLRRHAARLAATASPHCTPPPPA